jgi:dihydrofolate synthase / folylpolyglutamate synthase
MNYTQAIEYIQNLSKFGINLGMERIERLLALLDNPEQDMQCIHIAGTNGKGSTAMMLAAVLQAAGYKVGVYTSPHLQSYTERFTIGGEPIGEADFARLVSVLQQPLEHVLQTTQDQPTEFEVLTAMAFYYFKEQAADYVILEVGLGGTLDSTNVITPLLSVITNVAFDHMDKLGTTLAEIASHKAGIIKPAIPVITAATGDALHVIETEAKYKKASVSNIWKDCLWECVKATSERQIFHLRTPKKMYRNLHIRLLGPHQLANCAVTVRALEQLMEAGVFIEERAIYEGLAAARWPGRFEVVSNAPCIILDGAHNPDGAKALRATLETVFPAAEIVLVVGILADKDYKTMLTDFSAVANLMIVTTADSPRAADPAVVANEITGCEVEVVPDLAEAIAAGVRQAGMGKVMCVCGSLYTIGKARDILVGSKS